VSPDAFLLPVKPTTELTFDNALNNKVLQDILIYFLVLPERRARILFRVKEINLLQAKKQAKNRLKLFFLKKSVLLMRCRDFVSNRGAS